MPDSKSIPLDSYQVRKLLRLAGIRAKKSLGQHFLIDEQVLNMSIDAAELSPKDTVIEVGPGLGILTEQLGRYAGKVIAVELDDELSRMLKNKFADLHNISIIHNNIFNTNVMDLLGTDVSYKVVANLPYNIASAVLRHFIYSVPKPKLMIILIQKEVAETIVAKSGNLSVLSISLGIYTTSRIISYVSADSFYPKPRVDSALVKFDFFIEPMVKVDDIEAFLQIVKAGFKSPRKQLKNSLAQGLNISIDKVMILLEKAQIEPKLRPETLSIVTWQRLYEVIKVSGKTE